MNQAFPFISTYDPMPSVSNVAAGSTATLSFPLGKTIEIFALTYSGVTLAQLKNPRIEIDGKVVISYKDAAELDMINQYYGRGAANGILNFYFVRPEMKTNLDKRLTALGTADIKTLAFLVDIDAAAAAPALSGEALRSANQPLGLINKVKAFPVSWATSGAQEIDNIPRSGARIAAIHMVKDDVSAIEVEANGERIAKGSKASMEELQTRAGRTPQTASATHVDFILDDEMAKALPTVGLYDFRVRPTIDASGAGRLLVEYLDGWKGI